MWAWLLSGTLWAEEIPEPPEETPPSVEEAPASEPPIPPADEPPVYHFPEVDDVEGELLPPADIEALQADSALLEALLLFLSEPGGVEGATRLGELGDDRALPMLKAAIWSRPAPVAVAAIRALEGWPESTATLGSAVGYGHPDVQAAAVDALGHLGTEAAADQLVSVLESPDLNQDLRQRVNATLAAHYPHRLSEVEGAVLRDGTPWLVAGGAAGLGYLLAAAGHFGQSDLEALGAVTGALGGGTLGYVWGRSRPTDAGDAAFMATSGAVGTLGGVLIGEGVSGSSDAPWVVGLLGEGLGYGLGYKLADAHPGNEQDALEAAFLSGASAIALGGWMRFAREQGQPFDGINDPLALGLGLGGWGGLVAGHAIAPRVAMDDGELRLVSLATGYGALFGALLPIGQLDRSTLPLTTTGLGGLGGYALASSWSLGDDELIATTAGLGYGGAGGLGLAMLIDPDFDRDHSWNGGALLGATGGMALGGVLASRNPAPVATNDVTLTGLVTGWALWQAAGWYGAYQRDPVGLILLVPAALGGATAIASPRLDVPADRALIATSLGAWGAYVGAVGGVLGGETRVLEWSLVGSDVGLLGGAALMHPRVGVSPGVVGMADAGGVLGAALGALGASYVTSERDPILIASLVGAAGGAAAGAVAGAALLDDPQEAAPAASRGPRRSLSGRWSIAPAAFTDSQGAAVYGARLSAEGL